MKPEPVFEEPWHAQVFALTVHLNETGQLEWADWATRFGATLKAHGVDRDLNGGSDYFAAWLETLEAVLAERAMTDPDSLAMLKSQWEQAYLSTPHGEPVVLSQ